MLVIRSKTCSRYPPTIKTIAFPRGSNELIISMCLGEAVFPMITTIAIIMFGTSVCLNLQDDKIAKIIKADSSAMAFVTNFGLPIGIPIIPIMLIEIKITTIIFCCK